MSSRADTSFLTAFRDQFVGHFPEWGGYVRTIDHEKLSIEVPAPNPKETEPLRVDVDNTGDIMVSFGASHAHFDNYSNYSWIADQNNNLAHAQDIEAAITFIQGIVREEVISIYLPFG